MEQSEKTRKLLIACFQRYPQSEIRDLFKFLHQSAFGCEHLASSLEAAEKSIQSESETMRSGQKRPIEPLDGDYSRVPLCCCERGLSADTLAKLLIASAKKPKKDLSDLLQKMEVARQLVAEGALPFSPKEFEDAAAAWGAEGYPAVHHSQRFRENYQPSYRVIANEYLPIICQKLLEAKLKFVAVKKCLAICPELKTATKEDWSTEYGDFNHFLIKNRFENIDEAISHINTYGSGHSEAIITTNYNNALKFQKLVDASAVYVNASTRFTDGNEFGFGAEIGISTQKLHARGPMGLEALTTMKYLIYGEGQIR